MPRWLAKAFCVLLVFACCTGQFTLGAHALQSSSYHFDETTIGGGGLIQSNSTNFQSLSEISDLAVGETASTNFQIQNGSVTTDDPALSFAITSGAPNFGSFSPSTPATATATFTISNYTSYGYVVQIVGNAPSNGGHTLPAMASTGPSVAGTEQFGINLVANTTPAVGADPDHGQFGFGAASANYGTPDQFRFVSGETIVTAPKSSGITAYTISYLINVGSLTPGGQYTSNQTLIVTGTY